LAEKLASIESYKEEVHQKDIAEGKTTEANYTIYFKKPDKFRSENPETVTVWTSKVIWTYDKQKNEVRVREINASVNAFDFLGFILNEIKKYDVSLAGQEKVNGKECYLLDLSTDKKGTSQLQKVWVVKGEWYPARVQFRIEPPEGFQKAFPNLTLPKESTSILEFRRVEFDAEIPDEMFSIPENVNRVDLT